MITLLVLAITDCSDKMNRQLIVLTTTAILTVSGLAHAFLPSPTWRSQQLRVHVSPSSRRRRDGITLQYRDDGAAEGASAENQNQQEQQGPTAKRRFRSRRTRQQQRQQQQSQRQRQPRRRRERYPVSSFSHKLFAHSQILPPLDVTELPPTQAESTSAPKDTASTTLSIPYSETNRFTSEMLTPSLRQRDDPDDESCVPTVCGPLPVTYTNSPRVVERWLADNVPGSGRGASFVGFDVESVPNAPWIKHQALFDGPAVVQVSTPDCALVVQLTRDRSQRQSTACTAVSALLSDPSIVKVCTSIDEDMLELYRFNRQLKARSRFDLGGVGSGRGSKQRIGLQRLVRAVLGVEMKKSKKLAMSNWSKPLTKQQVEYAARDAWAGAAVIDDLSNRYPETFSAESIARLLRDERLIQEIHKRATRRKKARTQLKTIREQYQQYSAFDLQYKPQKLGLPPIVIEELDRLTEVLEETSPDGLIGFDAEPLGLAFDN